MAVLIEEHLVNLVRGDTSRYAGSTASREPRRRFFFSQKMMQRLEMYGETKTFGRKPDPVPERGSRGGDMFVVIGGRIRAV